MRGARRIILFVIAASASVASAQPSPNDRAADRDRALALFRESDADYKRGDFEHAAQLLREAYSLHPEPILLYNLARALEGVGDFEGAIESYERYLNAATQIPDRGAIERRIATLRAKVESASKPDPSGSGTQDHTTPPVSDTRTRSPSGGGSNAIGRDPKVEQRDDELHGKPQRLPWLIAGGGGLVLGGGALFGYLSQQRHDAAVSEPVQAEAQNLQDQAETFATTSNIAFAVGGVAVIGGVTWALLSRRHDRRDPKGPTVSIGLGSINATWVLQ
jgi:tetratricopeptide (TPR) repeat protein